MKLLTKANLKALPPLYSNENVADPIAVVKFFDPTGSWTWYATEAGGITEDGADVPLADPATVDVRFFGLVDGFEEELGYFTLSELQSARGRLGLGIERDRHFPPTPLSQLRRAS